MLVAVLQTADCRGCDGDGNRRGSRRGCCSDVRTPVTPCHLRCFVVKWPHLQWFICIIYVVLFQVVLLSAANTVHICLVLNVT